MNYNLFCDEDYNDKKYFKNTKIIKCKNLEELKKKVMERWVPWFVGRVIQQQGDPKYYLKASSTGLSKSNKARLLEDVDRLIQRYQDIGFQDQQVGAGEFESVGICIGVGPHQ